MPNRASFVLQGRLTVPTTRAACLARRGRTLTQREQTAYALHAVQGNTLSLTAVLVALLVPLARSCPGPEQLHALFVAQAQPRGRLPLCAAHAHPDTTQTLLEGHLARLVMLENSLELAM